MILTILLCTLPMSLSPKWNGTDPAHRNQYELLTEALLDGKLYIDYDDVDARLEALDNPYDPKQRTDASVSFRWDHSYYKGRYYVYFGVVPVFIAFMPYRLITGSVLPAYAATQFFTAIAVAGFFHLFYKLRKDFFPELSFSLYCLLSAVLSFVSVWYAITAPAMYCTAIMSAICMELLSLNFLLSALLDSRFDRLKICFGSICAALAFGCRPTIALAGLVEPVLLYQYLRQANDKTSRLLTISIAITPFIIIAAFLMCYNYLRFENPFEFGQSYQLTVADQHNYNIISQLKPIKLINGMLFQFFQWKQLKESFPYISYAGVFLSFPILWWGFFVVDSRIRKALKERKLLGFTAAMILLSVIITLIDCAFSPYMLTRYQLDVNFLLSIATFISIGFLLETVSIKHRKLLLVAIIFFFIATAAIGFFMCIVPYDGNFTYCYPEMLEKIHNVIFFLH